MNPIVSRTELAISFEKSLSIRKRIFEFEDNLKDFFVVPFLATNIPDSFEPNYPRFEADSTNGHSKLRVTQNAVALATTYDENYRNDATEIRKYLGNRIAKLRTLLESENLIFFGFIIDLLFYFEETELNGLLSKHTGFSNIKPETIDFVFAFSIPFRERYYLTLTASKFLESTVSLPDGKKGEGQNKHGIQIKLDLNTKKSHHAGSQFQSSDYDELLETVFGLISESKLEDYLSGNLI